MTLHTRQEEGFTFSTTLHKNGDIDFAYASIPISVANISDHDHPVKIGLLDRYFVGKSTWVLFIIIILQWRTM